MKEILKRGAISFSISATIGLVVNLIIDIIVNAAGNEDFVSIARINTKIKYRPNDNLITFDSTKNKVYASPFYSYDELVKMADEELSGYCPPIRILQEYNISPR